MATVKWCLGVCLLASCLGVISSQDCPTGWKEYGNSCYLFVIPTRKTREMSWEDSKANCLGLGADLVSIHNSSEVDFIHKQTSSLGNFIFWIGLYRNKTTSNPRIGWIWSDGTSFTNPQQWVSGEPNNYLNNEKCAEVFSKQKRWNDNNCDKLFSSICKRRKGLPDPTIPTAGTPSPTKDPPPTCDHGWEAHNRSCYKFFSNPSSWDKARQACQANGGHLVRIDDNYEQFYLTNKARKDRQNYWIGLNDLQVAGRWVWEFRSSVPLTIKNWQSGEPNGLGVERCVEMYGYSQAGFWNDAGCNGLKSYICEKEEGRNMCPEGWIQSNDSCYQFNMDSSQVKSWADAQAACASTSSKFASLVKVTRKSEQDFITKQIQLGSTTEVWIGLNDIKNENVFRWVSDQSDLADTKYQIWANGRPSENKATADCVMVLASRLDGAWSVQDCSLKRNFVCMRHRDLPFCNAPLGMQNGRISDSQITASSFLNTSDENGPTQGRLYNNRSWCPAKADKREYLQVELPFLADVKQIVTQGSVSSYTLRFSRDGYTFRNYKHPHASGTVTTLTVSVQGQVGIVDTASLEAKVVRIYPNTWATHPCMRVEFVGCRVQANPSTECSGNNWEKGPGKLCFQFNWNYKRWTDARSFCLDQGGDLLTITTEVEKKAISERIRKSGHSRFWISLNDRDYRNHFYWSNNDANGIISWGSGAPDNIGNTNKKACVSMKYSFGGGIWQDRDCSIRLPFICMKGEPFVRKNFAQTGLTGIWISSAKYYWPLSAIDDKKILGTELGTVYGKVAVTQGVKDKPNSALQFSGAGSYIQIDKKFEDQCLTSPDYCSFGLTLSFMAWFDATAVNSNKRVDILGSCNGDEKKYLGLCVYFQSGKLSLGVSKISRYLEKSVAIADNEWKHYVIRWNQTAGINIAVNGLETTDPSKSFTVGPPKNPSKLFKIGLYSGTGFTSGQVRLAMVAFWDKMLSLTDVSMIYNTEFGSCSVNWYEYGMSCYQLNQQKRSYFFATTACQKAKGDLIDIDSNVEQAYIAATFPKTNAWISAHDKQKEGIFRRTSGEEISYSNWNQGQPDNWYNREDCGHIKPNGAFWNDLPCYYYLPFICEKAKEVMKPTNVTVVIPDPVTKKETLCHYTRRTIGCPAGLVISVNRAFWGREDKQRCTYVSIQPCGLKYATATTQKIKNRCNSMASCELHASETEQYLNDPCPSIHKYLEVNYTCTADIVAKTKCKLGWKNFKNRCYGLFDTPRSWNDAQTTCQKYGAQLLSVDGSMEQYFVTTLMERAWYSSVWIGLNDLKTKGVYEWSDGSSVTWTNWGARQPDERIPNNSTCVFMSLVRGKRGGMYWTNMKCNIRFPFMCKYSVAGSPTQKPATVPTAFHGKCHDYHGWATNSSDKLDSCYYIRKSGYGLTWRNAQSACRYISSNLASIQSKEENEYVRKLSKDTLWIGLEARGVFRGHVWADGRPVRYTNWTFGQPDSYNGLEACVEMNTDTGFWSDRDCNTLKSVVCKRAKRIYPVTVPTVVYPTPGSSLCKKGWTLFKGMCYIVGNDTSYDYLTWDDAEKKCQSLNANGGHLTSINSQEEQKFIEFLMKNRYAWDFWIGLNDLGTEGHYQWTDASGYNYANWNRKEPNDYHRQEDCVHAMRSNGKWNDHHCQMKFSFICRAYNESFKLPVKPTPPPRPQKDGYCPPGWIVHAQYCYEFHTDPGDYRTWDDARDACEKGRNSSANGELVSIHDEFELAFITIHIKGAKQWLWTGMNNKHGYSRFFWVDNTIANYFKWNTREPISWGYGRCVEIVPFKGAAGRWNAAVCSKRNGYICKKAASDKPFATPTPSPTEPKCKGGYKSYDKSCFKFVNDKKTFDDAREVCKKDLGDLMVVDNQFKQAYVVYLLERFIGSVWIGFVHEPYSAFKMVDHSSPVYTYWASGQPSRQLGDRSCTQVNITGTDLGLWDDVECSTTNPFICEIYKGEPKITIPLNGSCPDGWRYYNKHCYKYFSSGLLWAQAQYMCSSLGADLLSIHDDREQDFLIYYYQNMHPVWIWTGLNDRAVEQGYRWVDNSPLDYVNWGNGEPNDQNGYENCVEMQTRSGQWNDLNCNRHRSYMCKKKLECSSVIPLDPTMVSVTDTYNATTSGADKAIITDSSTDTAWCTNNTSGTAKIKIDLNQLVHVTGISVLGRTTPHPPTYVKSFRIEYERDENWVTFYPNRDSISTVQGNRQANVMVTRRFKHSISLDGLTVTPVTWQGALICMKIRLYGCAYVCQRNLVLPKPSRIPQNMIGASSGKYPHEAKQTGINGHAWCAETNDKKPWIKFNFDKEILITVIRTFGDRRGSYVKSYYVQFSGDGEGWSDYEFDGKRRNFQGNSDSHSVSRHNLANHIESQYVRIIPTSWNNKVCMRISLLGCEADCSKALLAPGKISKAKLVSSDKNSNPEYALFNTGKAWCTGKIPIAEQYLEIQLGKQYRLSKIGTQPSPISYKKGGKIFSYTMEYLKKTWFVYGPKGQKKVMIAINEDDISKPMVNTLTDYYKSKKGLKTNGIRIYPKYFTNTTICMRVELYGCLADAEIIPPTESPVQQKKLDVALRFTDIEWNDKLSDKKSEEFASTSAKIIAGVGSVYRESESYRSAKVEELTKGSVIAKIELIFNPQFAGDNDTLLLNRLRTAVSNGKVGNLEVDKEYFVREAVGDKQASTGDNSNGLSGGAIAGVVITVLILVAAAIGLSFFFYRRKYRANMFSPKHFDNPISYSSKAYDVDD